MTRAFGACSLVLLLGAWPPGGAIAESRREQEPAKLLVMLVVDQMRYDYLERFWSNFFMVPAWMPLSGR